MNYYCCICTAGNYEIIYLKDIKRLIHNEKYLQRIEKHSITPS